MLKAHSSDSGASSTALPGNGIDSPQHYKNIKPFAIALWGTRKKLAVTSLIKKKVHLKWFWVNSNFPVEVKRKGEPIKILYEITGYDLFINDNVK